jgi:hypothetical protein
MVNAVWRKKKCCLFLELHETHIMWARWSPLLLKYVVYIEITVLQMLIKHLEDYNYYFTNSHR